MTSMEITLLLLSIIFASIFSYFLYLIKNQKAKYAQLMQDTDLKEKLIESLKIENQREKEMGQIKLEALEREIKLKDDLQSKMKEQFESLSQQALLKSLKELKQNSNHEINQVISPFKENLQGLKSQIEKFYINEEKERFALKKEINQVVQMGNLMSQETSNLTKALKGDSKQQGDWGEMILENLLNFSGLEKDLHYIAQGEGLGLKDENGKRQKPDVIINLPSNKSVIIDSKVSLTHYERFINEEKEGGKQPHLDDFLNSIKSHLKDLSSKKYQLNEKLYSPEFVLMFLPIEQAFSLANSKDKNLFENAFEKSIIIVSPSTLLACLKLIYSIWRQENSNKNSEKIAIEAGKIYDKMALFQEDLLKLGDSMNKNKMMFDSCMNKFSDGRGNLISRFENLKKLGAKTQKSIRIESEDSKNILN
jgi:DNA recombination protein RmuC